MAMLINSWIIETGKIALFFIWRLKKTESGREFKGFPVLGMKE